MRREKAETAQDVPGAAPLSSDLEKILVEKHKKTHGQYRMQSE